MSEGAIRRMSADEFLEWDRDEPDSRHELIDGVPFAKPWNDHGRDRIVIDALTALHTQLRGGPCRPFTADVGIKIPNGNVRRAHVGIDCAKMIDDALFVGAPRLLLDVRPPSGGAMSLSGRLEDYKTIPGLEHILLIEPEMPEVVVWSRHDTGAWEQAMLKGIEAVAVLPALGIALRLADIYEGLTFGSPPRLVADQA